MSGRCVSSPARVREEIRRPSLTSPFASTYGTSHDEEAAADLHGVAFLAQLAEVGVTIEWFL